MSVPELFKKRRSGSITAQEENELFRVLSSDIVGAISRQQARNAPTEPKYQTPGGLYDTVESYWNDFYLKVLSDRSWPKGMPPGGDVTTGYVVNSFKNFLQGERDRVKTDGRLLSFGYDESEPSSASGQVGRTHRWENVPAPPRKPTESDTSAGSSPEPGEEDHEALHVQREAQLLSDDLLGRDARRQDAFEAQRSAFSHEVTRLGHAKQLLDACASTRSATARAFPILVELFLERPVLDDQDAPELEAAGVWLRIKGPAVYKHLKKAGLVQGRSPDDAVWRKSILGKWIVEVCGVRSPTEAKAAVAGAIDALCRENRARRQVPTLP